MKPIILSLCLLIAAGSTAQKAVLLHKANGTQQAFYSNQPFVDAYNAAGNGDTIYVPGGYFSPVTIDKRIKLFGAGHYPDSTSATGTTVLNGGIYLGDNADSTLIEGFSISSISIGTGAEYVKIKRNKLENTLSVGGNYGHFEGNVLKSISGVGPAINLFTNNIIEQGLYNLGNGNVFRNNIFLAEQYALGSSANNYVVFENNIFASSSTAWNYNGYSVFNTFTKNVFGFTPDFSGNTASGNYFNVTNIFVTQSGYVFNYGHNYHLQSPGTYTGVDATQCGIYGGLFIYKEGAVPANPHIISKTISATTDGTGKLNATIKVAAQNN